MAPRFPGRRRSRDAPPPPEPEPVHLDDDDHAWWAQREVSTAWTPPAPSGPAEQEDAPQRDVLAEHFGPDWRTSFGYPMAAAAPPPSEAPAEAEPADPYAVLGVDPSATWDDIVDAHRTMARRHHPDRLVGRSDGDVAAGEARIRTINAAYAELKVRRGR